MLESPLIEEIVANKVQEKMHLMIVKILESRFGPVPQDLITTVQAIHAESKLEQLAILAGTCPDLETFRARLTPSARKGSQSGRRARRNGKRPSK